MKFTDFHQAVDHYGHIYFATKHWPEEHDFIKSLILPKDMFPNWKVLDTQLIVRSISCNIDMHAPLLASLQAVQSRGLGHLLKTFDGAFNIRMVRGSVTTPSLHAYGLAIDINASENQLGQSHGGFYDHPDFVECFTAHGFSWGGKFHRKDPMHYSFGWE